MPQQTTYTVLKGTHGYTRHRQTKAWEPTVTTREHKFTATTELAQSYVFDLNGWKLQVFKGYVAKNSLDF